MTHLQNLQINLRCNSSLYSNFISVDLYLNVCIFRQLHDCELYGQQNLKQNRRDAGTVTINLVDAAVTLSGPEPLVRSSVGAFHCFSWWC
jgi:hypothetical protein